MSHATQIGATFGQAPAKAKAAVLLSEPHATDAASQPPVHGHGRQTNTHEKSTHQESEDFFEAQVCQVFFFKPPPSGTSRRRATSATNVYAMRVPGSTMRVASAPASRELPEDVSFVAQFDDLDGQRVVRAVSSTSSVTIFSTFCSPPLDSGAEVMSRIEYHGRCGSTRSHHATGYEEVLRLTRNLITKTLETNSVGFGKKVEKGVEKFACLIFCLLEPHFLSARILAPS